MKLLCPICSDRLRITRYVYGWVVDCDATAGAHFLTTPIGSKRKAKRVVRDILADARIKTLKEES